MRHYSTDSSAAATATANTCDAAHRPLLPLMTRICAFSPAKPQGGNGSRCVSGAQALSTTGPVGVSLAGTSSRGGGLGHTPWQHQLP